MMAKKMKPVHPGEILLEEFLKPMDISQYRLAKDIGVQPTWINQIIKGNSGVSADMALRLGRFFSMSAQFWMNLQTHYELEIARDDLAGRLKKEVTPHAA